MIKVISTLFIFSFLMIAAGYAQKAENDKILPYPISQHQLKKRS